MKLKLALFPCLLLAASVFVCLSAVADEGHHHDLSEQQLGTVNFPVSCSPAAQQAFTRGVALLHSFWYEEAEKSFLEAQKVDAHCPMAAWGVTMSLYHQLWDNPDKAALARGREVLAKAPKASTPREQEYMAALTMFVQGKDRTDHNPRAAAYSQAMEKLYQHYPEDREAAAFYALSLLGSEPDHDTTFANRKKAAAVLEKLFTEEPTHPGVAHYLIHTYDKPQLAQLGLEAARRYAKIAPASPHALHMPSHIFARVGDWPDDITSNLASIEATRKTAAMHMGGASHQFHAMDFLIYAYLQTGREAEVQRLIAEVRNMPVEDHGHEAYGSMRDMRAFALSQYPAVYALELRRWSEAAQLQPAENAWAGDQAITYFARAVGSARSGNPAQAHKELAKLAALEKQLREDHRPMMADLVSRAAQAAGAWTAHAEGRHDEAIKTLRALSDQEDAEGEEQTATPAREMLADMLLELNRPQEALAEFQMSLKFNPGRFNGLTGAAQAADKLGQKKEAGDFYSQLLKNCEGGNSVRPELERARQLVARN